MLKHLQIYIEDNNLFAKEDKLLLAVSGGMDSIFMLRVLHSMGYDISVAHVNHKLRGIESDQDADFVKALSKSLHIPYYSTDLEWKDHSGSIQSESRRKRYSFFNKVLHSNQLDFILTAHHADDSIETFLMNALRGTGINGLIGIPKKRDHIRRPILCLKREEIQIFVEEKGWNYREDSSNQESKYRRNFLRNKVIPIVANEIPNYQFGMIKTIENLSDTRLLLTELVNQLKEGFLIKNGELICINKAIIGKYKNGNILLFSIFKEYGFSATDIRNLIKDETKLGSKFISASHTLIVKKDEFLVIPNDQLESSFKRIVINQCGKFKLNNGKELSITTTESHIRYDKPNIEFISQRKLEFPLELRSKNEGDQFQPIGMNGKKKSLKKFLNDQGLSSYEKNQVPILVNANEEIIWVVGQRLDHRYSVSEKEGTYYKLEYK